MKARCQPWGRLPAAFTLLELLVVMGLVAALSATAFSGLAGGGRGSAMSSAQATLAGLVTAARTRAPATGHKLRLLVNLDPQQRDRYLRLMVLQLARQAGPSPADWDTVQRISLPDGIYVVPATLAGLVALPGEWKRVSDPASDLVSDLFSGQVLSLALEGELSAQVWTGVAFTPAGTLAAVSGGPPPKGTVVLAAGRLRDPDAVAAGALPVELENPQGVRGLLLSAYGVPALLRDRNAF